MAKRILISMTLALCCLAISLTSWAQLGSVSILGAGASTCSKYLLDSQGSQALQGVYGNWALGYMTALNVINSGKPGSKMMSDATGLTNRINTFCLANQSKTFSDAVTAAALEFFR